MQRIIPYNIDDIAFDPDEIATMLNDACEHRRVKYTVRGVCQAYERVYFILLPMEDDRKPEEYVIKPIEDASSEGMVAHLEGRWESGFDTVGSIQIEDMVFGVFAKPPA